jgi:hypothetical protein
MTTGRRRPRVSAGGNKALLAAWGKREQQLDQRRREVAQAIAWGPRPAAVAGRPAWLRLGAWFEAEGQVLAIISIRPNGRGGWELMGQRTTNRWYDAAEVTPL